MNTIIPEHVGPANPSIQLHVPLFVQKRVFVETHSSHGPRARKKVKFIFNVIIHFNKTRFYTDR